jgi:hypothetical protein
MTVQDLVTTFEEAPIHFLPKGKDVVYDAIKRGVQENQFALYSGGIGDIIAIDQENFRSVGERFYFGRAPDAGVRDGHYLLPKERARQIEGQLNEIAEQYPPVYRLSRYYCSIWQEERGPDCHYSVSCREKSHCPGRGGPV